MRRAFRRWSILLLALALVSGQSAGLQLLAWAGMLITRAPDQGWALALESTFDGAHPCCVCEVVAALEGADAAGGSRTPSPDKTAKPVKSVDLHPGSILVIPSAAWGERRHWAQHAEPLPPQHRPLPEPRPPRSAPG